MMVVAVRKAEVLVARDQVLVGGAVEVVAAGAGVVVVAEDAAADEVVAVVVGVVVAAVVVVDVLVLFRPTFYRVLLVFWPTLILVLA